MLKTNKILKEPSYHIEGINDILYNAMIYFMETNNLEIGELAKVLRISERKVYQILTGMKLDLTIKEFVEILLKMGKYPVLKLEDLC